MDIKIIIDKDLNIPLDTIRYHVHQQLLEVFNIEILSDGNFYLPALSKDLNKGYYSTTYISSDGEISYRKLKATSFYHAQSMSECKHEIVTAFFCDPEKILGELDDEKI